MPLPLNDPEAIKEFAKNAVAHEFAGYAYPVVPTDEYGVPLRYDAGCVPYGEIERF